MAAEACEDAIAASCGRPWPYWLRRERTYQPFVCKLLSTQVLILSNCADTVVLCRGRMFKMVRSRKVQAASEADVRRDQSFQNRSNASGSRLRVRRGSSLTDLDKLRCGGGSSGGGSIGDLMNMFSGSANSVGSDSLIARTVPLETVRRTIPPVASPPAHPPPSPLIHVSRPVGPLTMAQRTLRFSRLLKYQPCSADVAISLVSVCHKFHKHSS